MLALGQRKSSRHAGCFLNMQMFRHRSLLLQVFDYAESICQLSLELLFSSQFTHSAGSNQCWWTPTWIGLPYAENLHLFCSINCSRILRWTIEMSKIDNVHRKVCTCNLPIKSNVKQLQVQKPILKPISPSISQRIVHIRFTQLLFP